jgi:hypothetical protein
MASMCSLLGSWPFTLIYTFGVLFFEKLFDQPIFFT